MHRTGMLFRTLCQSKDATGINRVSIYRFNNLYERQLRKLWFWDLITTLLSFYGLNASFPGKPLKYFRSKGDRCLNFLCNTFQRNMLVKLRLAGNYNGRFDCVLTGFRKHGMNRQEFALKYKRTTNYYLFYRLHFNLRSGITNSHAGYSSIIFGNKH